MSLSQLVKALAAGVVWAAQWRHLGSVCSEGSGGRIPVLAPAGAGGQVWVPLPSLR